jgi:hypothetical protein
MKSAGSEVMDRKRSENQWSNYHLLCHSSELSTKTILWNWDEGMPFSVMFSRIGTSQINSQDPGPIVILRSIAIVSYFKQKMTCAFPNQTTTFCCFLTYQNAIFELSSMDLRTLSYHSTQFLVYWKSFNDTNRNRVNINVKNRGVIGGDRYLQNPRSSHLKRHMTCNFWELISWCNRVRNILAPIRSDSFLGIRSNCQQWFYAECPNVQFSDGWVAKAPTRSPLEFAKRREPGPVKNVSGNLERPQAKTYLLFQE